MSLFSTLNTGISGLNAAEVAIATTGHNISNANNEYYTRQRVQFSASTPLHGTPGDIGTGVTVMTIARIHDEFVFGRLRESTTDLSYTTYSKQILEETAKYFPDLNDVGLQQDMSNYFDAWNKFASNPTEGSQKINLLEATQTLANNLNDTRNTLRALQDSINDQIKSNIDNLNQLGEQIAELNKKIGQVESVDTSRANDLRDQRDELELTLAKLVDFNVYKGSLPSENQIDVNLTDRGKDYNLNIAGFSFVDGTSFHPIVVENSENQSTYYSLYHERQDNQRIDMTTKLTGGKIGAMLDLRGRKFDNEDGGGYPENGTLQSYIQALDSFATSLIVQTNNIYAESAVDSMQSSTVNNLKDDSVLVNFDDTFQEGEFDVIVYDAQGNEVARKTLTINQSTTINDDYKSESIVSQFNSNSDDNADNNSANDVDDYFHAFYTYDSVSNQGELSISATTLGENYKIAIEDKGTNFAGKIGLNRFFSGDDASNISLDNKLREDPDRLEGFAAPVSGNNDVANKMVQFQYEQITFTNANGTTSSETIEGYYRFITTVIATDAESTGRDNDTNMALYNTVYGEFQSISGVQMDEELTNLMKFQTAYSANAKTLTTIDQMLDTLLSIKQ